MRAPDLTPRYPMWNPVNNRAAFMLYCLDAGLQRFTWISTVWSNRHGVKQADAFTQTE